MTDDNHSTDNRPTVQNLEQRIAALEDENEELKSGLKAQQKSGLPNVTRRQALGGLLGGGALLGAAGSASAQPPSGERGPPFEEENHDHSGDGLGEGTPVEAIRTGELNNVEIVRPGDDIQAAIDRVYTEPEPDTEFVPSGMVRFLPDHSDNRVIYEFPDPPYVVRKGVTLDMRGISAQFVTDAEAMFDLRGSTNVLGHGAHFDEGRPPAFTGALWFVNGDGENRVSMNTPANVYGFPSLGAHVTYEGDSATTALLQQTEGSKRDGAPAAVAGCHLELGLDNTKNIVKFNSIGEGGWINRNTVLAKGAVARGNAVEYNVDAGPVRGNYVWIEQLQIKGNMERILYCHGDNPQGLSRNYTAGYFVDYKNMGTAIAEWGRGVGPQNPLLPVPETLVYAATSNTRFSAIDNSGTYGNYVGHLYSSGQKPSDLSQRNGFFDGARAADDGTNTSHRGVECTWDNANAVWVRPDGTTFEGVRRWFHPPKPQELSISNQSLTVNGDVSELSDISGLKVDEDFEVHNQEPTVSGTVWVTWDQSNLYLAADLLDNDHEQPKTGVQGIWYGDVLEMGVAKGEPSDNNPFTQIDATLTPEGPKVFKGKHPGDWYIGTMDIPVEIIRNKETNHTRYEIALPWEELPVDATADVFSLGLAIRDVDEGKTGGFCQWGGGLLGGKDTTEFNRAELVGN